MKIISVTIVIFSLLTGCTKQKARLHAPPSNNRDIIDFSQPFPPGKNFSPPAKLNDPNGVINLRQALAHALLKNPRLQAQSWQIRAEQASRLQASLKPNPELGLGVEDFGGSAPYNGFEGSETALSISQRIEVADKRKKRQTLADLEKNIAGWDYRLQRIDVFAEVIKAYTDVLSAQQRLILYKKLLNLSEELVRDVSERVKAGKDPPLDLARSRIILADIRINYQQVLNELAFARVELASTWAGQPRFQNVTGNLTPPKQVPPLEKLTGLLDDNPEIKMWSEKIKKARARHNLEKALGKQDLTISGGITWFQEPETTAFMVGLSVPLGISDQNQGNRRRSIFQLAKTIQLKNAAKTRLRTELASGFKEMANAFESARHLKKTIIPAAEQAFRASERSYELGKISYLDLLDTQRTYFESMSRQITAQSKYQKAKAEVEKLINQKLNTIK